MTDLEDYSLERLRKMIAETEETLAELKTELERRQLEAQEHEIEHLEEHMKKAALSLDTIREFLKLLLDEYRAKE